MILLCRLEKSFARVSLAKIGMNAVLWLFSADFVLLRVLRALWLYVSKEIFFLFLMELLWMYTYIF